LSDPRPGYPRTDEMKAAPGLLAVGQKDRGWLMQWWVWLIIVVVVIAVLVVGFILIQARRRRGGVIISDRKRSKR